MSYLVGRAVTVAIVGGLLAVYYYYHHHLSGDVVSLPIFLGLPQMDMLLLANNIIVRINSSNDQVQLL